MPSVQKKQTGTGGKGKGEQGIMYISNIFPLLILEGPKFSRIFMEIFQKHMGFIGKKWS